MRRTVVICDKCGRREYLDSCHDSNIAKIMLENSLCHECAVWKNIIDRDNGMLKVIGRFAYVFYKPQYFVSPNGTMGQNGRWTYILNKDGSVYKSNDVWPCGMVPSQYREELPDSSWFISCRAYNIIKRRSRPCARKGCADRFHCYLYDIWTEKDGLFRKIRKDYIIGEERCPSFVNILKDIHRYDVVQHHIDSKHLSL